MEFSYASTSPSMGLSEGPYFGHFGRGDSAQSTASKKAKARTSVGPGKRIRIISALENVEQGAQPAHPLQQLFETLVARWRVEVVHVSSPSQMAMHPAYQRIIGMGPSVLPLIIRDLQQKPDWWFWALRAITGIDPVHESSRGKLGRMTQSWLEWWETEGKKNYDGKSGEPGEL